MEKIQENRTYRLHLPVAQSPDDWYPTGISVWSEDFSGLRTLRSGDVVMLLALAPSVDPTGRHFHTVMCEDGFVGNVCWDNTYFTLAD